MKGALIGFISGIVGIVSYKMFTGEIAWSWHYLGYPLTMIGAMLITYLFIYYQMMQDK